MSEMEVYFEVLRKLDDLVNSMTILEADLNSLRLIQYFVAECPLVCVCVCLFVCV